MSRVLKSVKLPQSYKDRPEQKQAEPAAVPDRGERKKGLMSRHELVATLMELGQHPDAEGVEEAAIEALLDFINDAAIEHAWNNIHKYSS